MISMNVSTFDSIIVNDNYNHLVVGIIRVLDQIPNTAINFKNYMRVCSVYHTDDSIQTNVLPVPQKASHPIPSSETVFGAHLFTRKLSGSVPRVSCTQCDSTTKKINACLRDPPFR